jgi:predicted DNA-binding protein
MNQEPTEHFNDDEIPASLRRRKKEPSKMVGLRIPLSWWEELSALAREFDQDVSTFLREATEDWLRRARKVHQTDSRTSRDVRPR